MVTKTATIVFSLVLLVLESQSKPSADYLLLDEDEDDNPEVRRSPEDRANIFSRLTYSWISSLIAKGYETPLQANDVYKLGHKYRPDVAAEEFHSIKTAIYRKTLVLSNDSRQKHNIGSIISHMTSDGTRVMNALIYLTQRVWTVPLNFMFNFYMLYQTLGYSTLGGAAVIVASIPLSTYFSKKIRTINKKIRECCDERVKATEEVLSGIKFIKLSALEAPFMKRVNAVRDDQELDAIKQFGHVQSVFSFNSSLVSFIVSFTTFSMYSMMDNKSHGPLNPQLIFVSLTLLNRLRGTIISIPGIMTSILETKVAYKRVYDYMMADEIDMTAVEHMPYERYAPNASNDDVMVKVTDGRFKWLSDSEPTVTDINLQCKRNEFLAVIGKVGSGKSSLTSAILGDMIKDSGHVFTRGRLAYVPQVPWIMNATLRTNVLFGSNYDPVFYDKVIDACSLRQDIDMLPAGDLTEIGEKGINLSGGQKARLALARAVYSRADVYVLDDPLAAVDAHVCKHIFTNVLGPEGLLKSRARVLVTNAMQYLKYADNIAMLDDGKIIEQCDFRAAMENKGKIFEFIHKFIDSESSAVNSSSSSTIHFSIQDSADKAISDDSFLHGNRLSTLGQMDPDFVNTALARGDRCSYHTQSLEEIAEHGRTTTDEINTQGSVQLSHCWSYIKACGMKNAVLLVATLFLAAGSRICASLWLKRWASANDLVNPSSNYLRAEPHSVVYYLLIYGLLGILGAAFNSLKVYFLWGNVAVAAASTIHRKMLNAVMRSPMSFFDRTPVGRIINRFSSDLDYCDISLPSSILNMVSLVISVGSSLLVINMSSPLVIVVVLCLARFYLYLQRRFLRNSRELTRLSSSSRSPLIAHLQESIAGATTIRAFGQQPRFVYENEKRLELNTRVIYIMEVVRAWMSLRLNILGDLIMLTTTLSIIVSVHYFGFRDAGMVGLAVSYSLSLSGSLFSSVLSYSSFENGLVKLERVTEYTDLPSEAPAVIEDNRPSDSWPEQGTVEFKNYSTRYREGLDLVLKNISFKIQPRQKVGVVGRTGAGKSSLTQALFRVIEAADGQILIDGDDIAKYGLFDVRSKLSIIPQDPILFAGTVRENLDPLACYTDQEIWQALENANLADFVRSKDERLDFQVAKGGENFSVGQRQLICMARALLKKARVLVLDEATAAIDNETDSVIQQTIRREFKDCTVITIAHRINTIIDSDMILVVDGGRLAEYDTPQNLLENKDSLFTKLVEEVQDSNGQ
ncbi:hypothetical protein LPJ63_004590 [Coemansia sp. RSA 2711]|nr:hypothetical protein LPJ63_004590 [Coemansia sp. RSA 2711]